MCNQLIRKVIIISVILLATSAANAGEREILFNGVPVSAHNIQVLEKSYGISFEDGKYWYDPSSGLWGSEGSGPEGRISAGLHLGGPMPESFAESNMDEEWGDEDYIDEEETSAEGMGGLVGQVLGLVLLNEMINSANEEAYGGYDSGYDGAYQTGPNSYYDGQGNYEYNTRWGGGSQSSDGSWNHYSGVAGGAVGGTSDGCVYTSVGGGWSNC